MNRSTELSKILILVEEINVDRLYEQLGELVGSTAHRVRGQFFIEIMNKDVNKGNGLAELCRALKVMFTLGLSILINNKNYKN